MRQRNLGVVALTLMLASASFRNKLPPFQSIISFVTVER